MTDQDNTTLGRFLGAAVSLLIGALYSLFRARLGVTCFCGLATSPGRVMPRIIEVSIPGPMWQTGRLAMLRRVLVGLIFLPGPHAQAASFTPLGYLPGWNESQARAISADGTVVVGVTRTEAFRWTAGSGMVGIGDLLGGGLESAALGVSADGSVVVGYGVGTAGQEAVVWADGGSPVGLGADIGIALGVSADGSVVVGQDDEGESFRWTSASGAVGLGDLPGGAFASRAQAISGDGAVIVGEGYSATGSEAFRWTSAGGMAGLGNLSGAGGRSGAYGASADGSVIVGYSTSANGYESFRWTSGAGMVGLADLVGGSANNTALGVSADGSVVVGQTGTSAYVWTEAGGMQYLVDLLIANGATGLEGWRLDNAIGISADGRWVAGTGSSPSGTQAFLANISPDADDDNVLDASDNCSGISNPDQCDSDGDGYGNRCDGDLNNSGMANGQDTTLFRQQLGQPSIGPTFNRADLDCNGAVNARDTTLFRQLLGKPPGPSGLHP